MSKHIEPYLCLRDIHIRFTIRPVSQTESEPRFHQDQEVRKLQQMHMVTIAKTHANGRIYYKHECNRISYITHIKPNNYNIINILKLQKYHSCCDHYFYFFISIDECHIFTIWNIYSKCFQKKNCWYLNIFCYQIVSNFTNRSFNFLQFCSQLYEI